MLLYMCDGCAEQDGGVGHDTPDHLRVCGDEWLCEGCYDDRTDKDAPRWRTMPKVISVGWQPLRSHASTDVFLGWAASCNFGAPSRLSRSNEAKDQAMSEWRSIDSAPFQDGAAPGSRICRPLLVYAAYPHNAYARGVVGVAFHDGRQWVWDGAYVGVAPRWHITKWMPVPDGPLGPADTSA